MEFEIKIKNLDEFQKLFKKAPEVVTNEFSKTLNKLASETERDAVKTARNLKIQDTGNILNQIRQKRLSKLTYAVISGAKYSINVEEGRKKGSMPPYKPIFEWVKRHYQRFSSFKTKKSKGAQADIKAATFLIRRKIFRKGIKPRPYMELTWQKMQRTADKHFDKALDNIIKKLAK